MMIFVESFRETQGVSSDEVSGKDLGVANRFVAITFV